MSEGGQGGTGLKREIGPVALLFTGITGIVGSGWLFAALYAAQLAGPAAILSWCIGGAVAVHCPHLRRARRHASRRRRHRAHPLLFALRHERVHGRLAVPDRLRGDRPHRGVGGAAVLLSIGVFWLAIKSKIDAAETRALLAAAPPQLD
jgi:hypothetical protein